MKNKNKLIKLVNLIQNVNDSVSDFEVDKTEKINQIEKLCNELNIDIEKIREEDALGFVDAVDYGRGFDKNVFIKYVNEFIGDRE